MTIETSADPFRLFDQPFADLAAAVRCRRCELEFTRRNHADAGRTKYFRTGPRAAARRCESPEPLALQRRAPMARRSDPGAHLFGLFDSGGPSSPSARDDGAHGDMGWPLQSGRAHDDGRTSLRASVGDGRCIRLRPAHWRLSCAPISCSRTVRSPSGCAAGCPERLGCPPDSRESAWVTRFGPADSACRRNAQARGGIGAARKFRLRRFGHVEAHRLR